MKVSIGQANPNEVALGQVGLTEDRFGGHSVPLALLSPRWEALSRMAFWGRGLRPVPPCGLVVGNGRAGSVGGWSFLGEGVVRADEGEGPSSVSLSTKGTKIHEGKSKLGLEKYGFDCQVSGC